MFNLTYKSIDIMKKTKDPFENQLSRSEKEDLINRLKDTGCTHIAIAIIGDDNSVLTGVGYNPSPRTIEAETQDWCAIIHAAGLNVMHRPAWGGEEAFNFTKFSEDTTTSVGTAASTATFSDNYSSFDSSNYTQVGTWSVPGGYLEGPTANAWTQLILTTTSYTDFTATARVQIPLTGSGNTQLAFRTSTSAGYGLQLRMSDQHLRVENWGISNLSQVSKTINRGDVWWVKVTTSGTTIQAKAWLDGSPEPGSWDINFTDSTYSSGNIGFSSESNNPIYYDLTIVPSVTNSTWCGRYYRYLYNHVGANVKSGDIFAPFPEGDDAIINHNWMGGSQTKYNSLMTEAHTITNSYAQAYGVNLVFMTQTNFSQAASGWMSGTVYGDQSLVACDYYGQQQGNRFNNPLDYVYDWDQLYAGKNSSGGGNNNAAGYNQFQSEWATLKGTTSIPNTASGNAIPGSILTIEERLSYLINFCKTYRDNLISPNGQLVGFNFWGGWEGQNTSILYKDTNGKYQLNALGKILTAFYKNKTGNIRVPVVNTGSTFEDFAF